MTEGMLGLELKIDEWRARSRGQPYHCQDRCGQCADKQRALAFGDTSLESRVANELQAGEHCQQQGETEMAIH
ncbi:hypothetical protein, partial [Dokdonella sp.]|uniref:hypothetical protein n=1 Tax=Dokdonella sp. TaxID=2291710 RepID=UPI003BAE9802